MIILIALVAIQAVFILLLSNRNYKLEIQLIEYRCRARSGTEGAE